MQNTERAPFERAHRDPDDPRTSLLYPLMLIAAIAVIVFSIVGIASLMGVMPRALSGSHAAGPEAPAATGADTAREAAPAAERRTGIIHSIHVVQTRLPPSAARAILAPSVADPATVGTRPLSARPLYSGEEFVSRHVAYRVLVRMDDDGRLRTFYEPVRPAYAVGQKVLVTGHLLHAETEG